MWNSTSYRPFLTMPNAPIEVQTYMKELAASRKININEIKAIAKAAADRLPQEENHERALKKMKEISRVHQHYVNCAVNNQPMTYPIYVYPIRENSSSTDAGIDLEPDFDTLLEK